MTDRHEFFLHIDDGHTRLGVRCPYDRVCLDRPCWPCHEDGIPDPPPQTTCVYEDWVDNAGLEDLVHGRAMLPLAVDVEWDNGSMVVRLRVSGGVGRAWRVT